MLNSKSFLIKIAKILPDRAYISLMYFRNFHKMPNLEHPQSYNEKIQWLKLYDRDPIYNIMVDKYRVKEFVANKIGAEYVVPLLGVWKNVDEIDIEKLPQKFVLKLNNGHGVDICKDKVHFDLKRAKKSLKKQMKNNLYWYGREWAYKNVTPYIIAEEFIGSEEEDFLIDYKVMCFNGKAIFVQVISGRGQELGNIITKVDFYDREWNKTTISQEGGCSNVNLEKPVFFDEMISLSEKLAENITNVRVDWYFEKNQLYFGEFTFYDGSGFIPFINPEDDKLVGSHLKLPIRIK